LKKKPKPKSDPRVLQAMHIEGVTYQLKLVSCGKLHCRKGCASGRPSHGPYWYRATWNPKTKKTTWRYHGKREPTIAEIQTHVDEKGTP